MKEIQVSVQGITPLLQHRFAEVGADEPSKKRTGAPDWKGEVEVSLYKDKDGKIYQPSEHFEKALKNSAKSFKIAGKRGATYTRLIGSSVEILPYELIHKIQHYVIDSRAVVIQKARVIRYRPRLDEWELDFTLRILDAQLPISVIKEILDYAGLYVGIGDYRPQLGGKFGKFMVIRFEEI